MFNISLLSKKDINDDMNSILNSCHDLQKKQVVMQETQLNKLCEFKALLESHKNSLLNSKFWNQVK